MKRLIVAAAAAGIIFGGLTIAALAIPSVCPGGTHAIGPSTCVSDGTHAAPSSGVSIPYYSTGSDDRFVLRIELVAVGLLGAWGAFHAIRRSQPTGVSGPERVVHS
jgi:hypothetical protein